MNLLFLYLTAAGMAVTLITGGSEQKEAAHQSDGVGPGCWDYAFVRRLGPPFLNAERMSEISPLSMSIT